jgi:predicted glycosyltransferase
LSAAAVPTSALIYVQHLLGIGHLARIARVAAAFRDREVRTTIVKGGMPVDGFQPDGVECLQLDPVRADPEALDRLVDASGAAFDASRKAQRRDALLAIMAARRPDILIIEAFPFGRRAMRFELVPLLEQARGAGVRLIATSIRDILQENHKPGRAEEVIHAVESWFDLVLVHGDEAITPLSASFALADQIRDRTVHTGLVGPEPVAHVNSEHAVVVSVGGGAVGEALIKAALEAAPHSALAHAPWLILTGPNMSDGVRADLRARATPSMEFRTFVSDLPARLAGARLSISQAGYNTVADLLVTGCTSVLIPFSAGAETEQLTRARLMQDAGRAIMLREQDLTPSALACAMARALALPKANASANLDGARRTAALVLSHL